MALMVSIKGKQGSRQFCRQLIGPSPTLKELMALLGRNVERVGRRPEHRRPLEREERHAWLSWEAGEAQSRMAP